MIVPKDIRPIFWTKGLKHLTGQSSIGFILIDTNAKELTIMNMMGTRIIKGKSVNQLKELADHYHRTHLFDSYKMYVTKG